MDDMIVKSIQDMEHEGLANTFEILRTYGMKLNPRNCIFGVRSGKFLGFMISSCEIEANLNKVKVVREMKAPQNIKELQRLTGCIATLGRSMSKSADKCQPFFHVLRRPANFL